MANPQKALERIHKATNIAFRGHDLRRTAASLMTGMGSPRLTVTAVYDRHSYDKEKREALEEWSKRLMVMVSDLKEVNAAACLTTVVINDNMNVGGPRGPQ